MSTKQAPIGSGFGAASTAREVIAGRDLSGKVAVVTGGAAGMGLEITKALLSAGGRVVVPARDPGKAEAAVAGLDGVEVDTMELTDPTSIDGFAARFRDRHAALDLLITNAGTMYNPLTRDSRGYEIQFSTNHLGHFQLTGRLWPALLAADGARVVALSSRGHQYASVDFDDPNFERRVYDRGIAYGQSKTANALFALELDARGESRNVRAFSVHPGGVITDLARYLTPEQLAASGYIDAEGRPIIDPERNMKTPAQGAATAVWCATSPQLEGMGGVYCENCDIAELLPADSQELLGVRPWAVDAGAAQKLWALSERLTGVEFGE